MDALLITLPMSAPDLKAIENTLRSNDLFTLSMTNEPNIVYSVWTYLREKHQNNTETILLLDRQLLSWIKHISLGKNIPLTTENEGGFRLASAIMAFAMIADLKVEPNIAIYEYADSNEAADASRDLLILRHADNTDPNLWIDLAQGRRNSMPQEAVYVETPVTADERLARPIRFFSFSRPIVLKMALLELSGGKPKDKVLALMRWMYEEFLFSGPCLTFAETFWGRSKMAKMIKHLRSADVEKRKQGIRNATWDLTYIYNWAKHGRERNDKCLWLAASDDKALKKIARGVLTSDEQDPDVKLLAYLEDEFGSSDANSIFGAYQSYKCRTMDPDRIMNGFESDDEKAKYCENLVARLEASLFGVPPVRANSQ
jgi:hypothetical protein